MQHGVLEGVLGIIKSNTFEIRNASNEVAYCNICGICFISPAS